MREAKKWEAVSEMLKEQLSANKRAVLHVTSNSMAPFLIAGDQIVVEAARYADLIPGDIILYFNGDTFCTHRFVGIFNTSKNIKLITKGDRLKGFDKPFMEDKIVGKVITIVREHKKIDLRQRSSRLFNKIFGKLLTWHWFIFRVGKDFKYYFHINNSVVVKLITKIMILPFRLFYGIANHLFIIGHEYNSRKKTFITLH